LRDRLDRLGNNNIREDRLIFSLFGKIEITRQRPGRYREHFSPFEFLDSAGSAALTKVTLSRVLKGSAKNV
jgi:hypothetical protein